MNNFKSYLQLLSRRWKFFYYYTIVFIIATLFCVFILRHSVPPVYVYTMYSYPIPEKYESYTFKILANNKEINTFHLLKDQGDVIRANLYRFYYLKSNNLEDNFYSAFKKKLDGKISNKIYDRVLKYEDLNDNKFGEWIVSYLEPIIGTKITNLKVYKTALTFSKNNLPEMSSNIIVLDYRNE